MLIVYQGVFIGKELEKQSPAEVKFMIDVNLVGSFTVIKAALPALKAREGHKYNLIGFFVCALSVVFFIKSFSCSQSASCLLKVLTAQSGFQFLKYRNNAI